MAAEHTCLRIAALAGLPVAESHLTSFDDVDALIVRRFDRGPGEGMPRRVHQEDACQALGIDLERGAGQAKYESGGGPRLRQVAALLEAWGDAEQRRMLLDQVTFTVVTANADAHGKNVSLLHPVPGEVALAPLYDTVPTALWPGLRTRAAMSIGAAVDLPDITVDDIVREGARWGMGEQQARARTLDVVDRVRGACSAADLPDHEITGRVTDLVTANCQRLLDGTRAQQART